MREKVAAQLAIWGVGTGDLAICGGACGSDILFAEECQRLGAPVRLLLALPRAQFVAQSVAFAGYDWVRRFDRLTETCEVAEQTSRLGDPPAGFDVFSRCNLWILNSARVEIGSNSHLFSILVWDEKPTGDGPAALPTLRSVCANWGVSSVSSIRRNSRSHLRAFGVPSRDAGQSLATARQLEAA